MLGKVAALITGFALVLMMPQESPAQTKWFLISILSAWFMGEKIIRPRLGTPAAMLFGYCVINGAWFWVFQNNRYINLGVIDPTTGKWMLDAYTQQAIRLFAADSIAKLLLVIPPLLYAIKNRDKLLMWGGEIAALFCLVNVLMVFYSLFFEPGWCQVTNSCGGALSNPSMNASLIVVTLPFIIDRTEGKCRWVLIGLTVIALILSKARIGFGLLAALSVLYAIKEGYWKAAIASPLVLLAGKLGMGLISNKPMFGDGGRLEVYQFFMAAWAQNSRNWVFGTGYGTFGIFSANLQRASGKWDNDWWITLHNDWLEILFALGIVGLVLAVAVYLCSMLRFYMRGEYAEAISLVLLGLMMGCNFPLHHPISALFSAWLVVTGLIRPVFEERKLLTFYPPHC